MRAVRFHRTGGPEVLRVETVDRPVPRADEVLVEVRAIGVNPTEVYSRTGERSHPLPRIPGADFAGVVVETGTGVRSFEPGDRVFGTGLQNDRQGTYAEFVPARVDRVAPLPSEVPFDVGAASGVVGTTAWLAFAEHSRLTPNSTCVVHGGSGGVGHVAVQLADRFGARVLSTAGSEVSRDFVAGLGADTVLDYAASDLRERIAELAPDGVDVVLDHRVGDYLQLDLAVLAPEGTVLVIGGPGDHPELTDLWPALRANATVRFFTMSNEPNLATVLGEVADLLASGRLDVHIARRYDLDEAAAAQRAVIDDSFHGKLVIVP